MLEGLKNIKGIEKFKVKICKHCLEHFVDINRAYIMPKELIDFIIVGDSCEDDTSLECDWNFENFDELENGLKLPEQLKYISDFNFVSKDFNDAILYSLNHDPEDIRNKFSQLYANALESKLEYMQYEFEDEINYIQNNIDISNAKHGYTEIEFAYYILENYITNSSFSGILDLYAKLDTFTRLDRIVYELSTKNEIKNIDCEDYIVKLSENNTSKNTRKIHTKFDFYPTPHETTKSYIKRLFSEGKLNIFDLILEPYSGAGDISNILTKEGLFVVSSEIRNDNMSYGKRGVDALKLASNHQNICNRIISNPPYGRGIDKHIEASINMIDKDGTVDLFLPLTFLEGVGKYNMLFSVNPPTDIYVYGDRQTLSHKGESSGSGTKEYAWFRFTKNNNKKTNIHFIKSKEDAKGVNKPYSKDMIETPKEVLEYLKNFKDNKYLGFVKSSPYALDLIEQSQINDKPLLVIAKLDLLGGVKKQERLKQLGLVKTTVFSNRILKGSPVAYALYEFNKSNKLDKLPILDWAIV